MADGRGNLCGWLSHVHYVLERKQMRYPATPALGRLLMTTSLVHPRWNPSVWEDIRRLEALTGVSFHEYLMNRVIPVLADPGTCVVRPGNISNQLDPDAHSVAAPATSGDYPLARNRTLCQKGKGKLVESSPESHGRSGEQHRGGDSSCFEDPGALDGLVAVGDGVGPLRILQPVLSDGTRVVAVAKDVEAKPKAEDNSPITLVPYSDTPDSDDFACEPARLGQLHSTASTPVQGK